FMHGKGTYVWSDGLKYEGDFFCNQMTGIGKFTWLNGSYYAGDVRNSVRHGRGVFYHAPRMLKYDGDWVRGLQHGKGYMTFDIDEKSYYKGDWVANKKQGYGVRKYISGNFYEGEWFENMRHGNGTMHWVMEKQKYIGQWRCGVQEGEGEHTWYIKRSPTTHYYLRNSYKGSFKNGLRDGCGCFRYACGAFYSGLWRDNKKNGNVRLLLRQR
ncbi:hypothetical protein HELRODRAFT_76393, partial [Helobdella robusta]|uniref:MORN repeat-containing protein 5 n=1 Tax=Helobdella robusta TaxID=6412 RepID=T1G2J5_HELRO